MGVKGLETFIEKYCPPDCCYEVSIENLVDDFRKETGGRQPTIVFHGATTLRFLYKNLDWVCGGQYKQYLRNIRQFIDAFKKLDVHLVFFFGGDHPIISRKTAIVDRCKQEVANIHKLFDDLKSGTDLNEIDPWLARPPLNFGLNHTLEAVYECEVHNMINKSEIVNYGRYKDCLAIYGQDSDFLIHETNSKYYLSAKHFNIRTMKTKAYDRQKLARFLNLSVSQLPAFASLVGNDFVNYMDLKPFHRSLSEKGFFRFENFYPPLAKYVKQLPVGEDIYKTVPYLTRQILQSAKKTSDYYDFKTKLRISLQNYFSPIEIELPETGKPKWDEILQVAESLHRQNINHPIILTVLSNKPVIEFPALEDIRSLKFFRIQKLPPSTQILLPLRQKLYGIILKEKPENVDLQTVEEWVNQGPMGFHGTPSIVNPIPPTGMHPGLLDLWSDNRSLNMQKIRWQLFLHTISPNLPYTADLYNLPGFLILPTCVLFYLKEQNILDTWEIETLLVTVILLPSVTLNQLHDLPTADPVNLKAVQIATIFTKSLSTIAQLLSVCGYPVSRRKAFSHPYFDGKLFQTNYRLVDDGQQPETLFENYDSSTKVKTTSDKLPNADIPTNIELRHLLLTKAVKPTNTKLHHLLNKVGKPSNPELYQRVHKILFTAND